MSSLSLILLLSLRTCFLCQYYTYIYIYIHFFIMIIVLVIYCYNHSCECISKYHHYYGSYFHCCHHHSCHSQDDCYDYHCHHSHFVGIVIVYYFCYYCVVVHICLDSIWGRSSPSNSPHQDYYMFSPYKSSLPTVTGRVSIKTCRNILHILHYYHIIVIIIVVIGRSCFRTHHFFSLRMGEVGRS